MKEIHKYLLGNPLFFPHLSVFFNNKMNYRSQL